MTTINTISDCAVNGFIIIAEVGKDDKLTGKFLKLNVSGASTEGPYDDLKDAMTAIEEAEPVSLAELSDHAYKGFFIVAELDGKKKTGFFLVFSASGVYKPPPHFSPEVAMNWIEKELKNRIVDTPKKRLGLR